MYVNNVRNGSAASLCHALKLRIAKRFHLNAVIFAAPVKSADHKVKIAAKRQPYPQSQRLLLGNIALVHPAYAGYLRFKALYVIIPACQKYFKFRLTVRLAIRLFLKPDFGGEGSVNFQQIPVQELLSLALLQIEIRQGIPLGEQ